MTPLHENRAVDLFVTYRFLKLLVTPWEKQEAYKLGIIDKNGKRTSKKVESSDEKSAFTLLHRLVFNFKRILSKIPLVRTQIGTYATALFLLKEHYHIKVDERKVTRYLMENNMIGFDNMISEDVMGFGNMLPAGSYKLKDIVTAEDEEIGAKKGDVVIAHEDTPPSDRVLGVDIFPVIHKNTSKKIYVSLEDIQ
jgi:hypothetical protein